MRSLESRGHINTAGVYVPVGSKTGALVCISVILHPSLLSVFLIYQRICTQTLLGTVVCFNVLNVFIVLYLYV